MIYLTGDTHGEIARFEEPVIRRLKRNDYLIVCGDFGFIWDDSKEEEKRLKKLGKFRCPVLFVDGKHENFDLLDRYEVTEWNGGKVQFISGNLIHLMRGQIYDIDGKKIYTFGGGESEDKEMRVEMGKWWEREMPTIDEMREGAENLEAVGKQVDYIITHEPPSRVKSMLDGGKTGGFNALDAYFEEISKEIDFKKWFFGSIHMDKKITSKHYAVFTGLLPVEPKKRRRA